MSAPARPVPDAEQAGRRVEEVLDRLAASGGDDARTAAEELVRALMDFYGAGLARVLALLSRTEPRALDRLLRDEPLSAMLLLHDLHPESPEARITRALEGLPGRPVELVGFDAAGGVLRVRSLAGGSGGCGCGGGTARETVEAALACFAPEVRSVEVEEAAAEPALFQISPRRTTVDAP